MLNSVPRIYPLLGLCGGYLVVLFFNPIRLALRDGLRCILRFKRIWLTFVLLGFAYSVFQFATFTPIHAMAELDVTQITAPGSWDWPAFVEVWREVPLPMLEGMAGIFDNATTTYPLSIVAANYGVPRRNLGAVSVVGPVRMDYPRAIIAVRQAANELSRFVAEVYDE